MLTTFRQYDKEGKISYGNKTPEKYYEKQWLAFQISGQGPYFGQRAWFANFHPEKLPSAIDRYEKEVYRVTKVIDSHLQKTGQSALVGNKVTYADLSFLGWDTMLGWLLGEDGLKKVSENAPHWKKWHDSLASRPAVKKVLQDKMKAMGQA